MFAIAAALGIPYTDRRAGSGNVRRSRPVGCLTLVFEHAADARRPNECVAMRLTKSQLVSANALDCDLHQPFCDTVRRSATRGNASTRTFNPKVPGSRPGRPTSSNRGLERSVNRVTSRFSGASAFQGRANGIVVSYDAPRPVILSGRILRYN